MVLVLTGGGNGKDTEEIDKYFASLVNKNKPLLYIPIAIDTIKHPYPECLKWLKQTFDKLGINKYEMVTEENILEYADKNPNNYGGIYIGGGNTPYLLKSIKESRLTKFLNEAVKQDIPIYGGSAGAIIFGKTIKSSLKADKNEVGLKDFNALNKAYGWDIWCHYIKEDYKTIQEFLSENKDVDKLIALSERNAILVSKEIEIIGQEPALAISNTFRKTVQVGEIIN
ncbi:Type 1 glutamine amidotransferase-like domain-containing protein [Candidatus Pacearchaeota archaeon]|nr:Type 1 glutamine amidotransferase-like domain-containing protein [Candidatus Pacearchaeota archaeon]